MLHSCKTLTSLKQIHASLITSSHNISSKLISLYANFNDLKSSISVFNSLQQPNTTSWNVIIKTHVDSGRFHDALLLYKRMRQFNVIHDGFTFPIINKAISSLNAGVLYGEMIHCVGLKMGFGFDVYFGNTMIEVYTKCGCIGYAGKVFDEMAERDVISWTLMISGYMNEGNFENAYMIFKKMRMEIQLNFVTVIVMLGSCCYTIGKQIHGYTIKNGLILDRHVQNSMLSFYGTTGCSEEEELERFFDEIDKKDIVSWNTLISSSRNVEEVCVRFQAMFMESGTSVETLTLVISAFAKSANMIEGKKLHCYAVKVGSTDEVFETCLLDFYAKCGDLTSAVRLFEDKPNRNGVTWSSMMSGYVQNGYFTEAIGLFNRLRVSRDVEPSVELLRNLVDAYANLGALQLGKGIHAYVIRTLSLKPPDENTRMETSILNMYLRCGALSSATRCFDKMLIKDVVAWTSMIEGYGTYGLGSKAMQLYHQMVEEEGVEPNSVTFLSLLSACSHSGLVNSGYEVIRSMSVHGIELELDHYTCLVDLLGRSGNLKLAFSVIMKMTACPDSRIWGALFSASRFYGDLKIGKFAAERVLELEGDNVGYHTLLSNVKAWGEEWSGVEEVRNGVKEKDLRKNPGWSCVEKNGRIYGFVSGDISHYRVDEIYEVLRFLSCQVREFGCL